MYRQRDRQGGGQAVKVTGIGSGTGRQGTGQAGAGQAGNTTGSKPDRQGAG